MEHVLLNLHDKVFSDIINKEIEGSITKTSLKNIRILRKGYKWEDSGVIKKRYGTTMLYLLFKSINLATRIGVSNLKHEIEKSTLANFGNNVKYLLSNMSSNYTIIIDKG